MLSRRAWCPPRGTKPACSGGLRAALSAHSSKATRGARLVSRRPQTTDAAPSRRRLPSPRQLRPIASLWPYIGRYPGMLAAAVVALMASAAAMLAVPVAMRGMVDHGFSQASPAPRRRHRRLFLALIALGLALAVASAARMYAVNWLGERVVADLRAQVFRHLATLGPAFYETTHSGEVMSRLTADTTQIKWRPAPPSARRCAT